MTVAGFVYKIRGEKGLLALYWSVFVEGGQGEHFAGFFAGFGVHEEVLHEDLWSGGVRGAMLIAVVFFDVVLSGDGLKVHGNLDSVSVGMGDYFGLWSGCHYDKFEVGSVAR